MKHWRFIFLLIAMALAAGFIPACTFLPESNNLPDVVKGSGNVMTETREVSGFDTISLQGMGNVIVDQTGSESLQISADDNFFPYLVTEVRGHTLYLGTSREAEGVVFSNVTDLTFHVNAAALEAIELAGAGSFEVNDLDTETWQVTVPGAGSVTVSGRTREQTVRLDGASGYTAENLDSNVATIVTNGAGMAVVRVNDELDVTVNGLGKVEYIGNPVVKEQINGLGFVSKRP
jgi:hypothetical protein